MKKKGKQREREKREEVGGCEKKREGRALTEKVTKKEKKKRKSNERDDEKCNRHTQSTM